MSGAPLTPPGPAKPGRPIRRLATAAAVAVAAVVVLDQAGFNPPSAPPDGPPGPRPDDRSPPPAEPTPLVGPLAAAPDTLADVLALAHDPDPAYGSSPWAPPPLARELLRQGVWLAAVSGRTRSGIVGRPAPGKSARSPQPPGGRDRRLVGAV